MRWVLLGLLVISTVISDLLQSHEMKLAGEQSGSARGLLGILGLIWRIVKGAIKFVFMIGLLLVIGYVVLNVLR